MLTKSYGQAAHARLIDGVNDDPVSLAVRVRIYRGHCGRDRRGRARMGWGPYRRGADSVRYHLDLTPELLLRPAFHQANER